MFKLNHDDHGTLGGKRCHCVTKGAFQEVPAHVRRGLDQRQTSMTVFLESVSLAKALGEGPPSPATIRHYLAVCGRTSK